MCVVVVYIIQSTSASQHRFRDTFINMFIIFKFMVYSKIVQIYDRHVAEMM